MKLDEIRREIDEIDGEVKALFLRRMKISERVAESKILTGDKILKPEREEQVIRRLTEELTQVEKQEVTSLMKKVMEISRARQYKKMIALGADFSLPLHEGEFAVNQVCYPGLPGSYSECAAASLFEDCTAQPLPSFEDVFVHISNGSADMGVVPLANTTAGGVNEVYDLLQKYDLFINYNEILKVDHCLAGVKGSSRATIQEVYSHPQAIAQSRKFLKSSGYQTRESSNTAVAARDVALANEMSKGAICSAEAAKRYGLQILEEEINHNKSNATKFIAVSKKLITRPTHDRVALVLASSHRSGSLASVLSMFSDYGINLTSIHSRPDGKHAWEYLFYVDFAGNLKEDHVQALFYQLTEELPFVKILGSYENKQ